jgi:F0F1-type ATP synthase assembly protein I
VAEKKPFMEWAVECTSLAFLLPVATFVGYGLGYVLDKTFGTHWIYIPSVILGIAVGFVLLVRRWRRDIRDDRA